MATSEGELRMTLAGAGEPDPDGRESAVERARAGWQKVQRFERGATGPGQIKRLGEAVFDALQVVTVQLARVSALQQEQFRVLTWIRQTCDAAAGVQRERRDKRMPGAKGAVRVLVERYRAQGARLAAVSAELEALRVAHDRLAIALAEKEGWQAGLPPIAPAARE
jgi:hypothetical protein